MRNFQNFLRNYRFRRINRRNMTNLSRWLFYFNLFFIPYLLIAFRKIEIGLLDNYMFEVRILPIILVFLFGLYSAAVVLYRVFTFNDCPEAAKELQEEILEARKDLISKGFKFRD